MKTASSKAKGRKLQQLVRDKILDAFPRLEPDDVKSTSMGASGEDIQLSPAARRWFPFSTECKSRATVSVYAWYQQAKTNSPTGMEPLLVIKQNNSKPLVVIDLDSFMELVK
jgi:hypothetical protein